MPALPLETIARGFKCELTSAGTLVIQTTRDWKMLLEGIYGRPMDPDGYNFRSTTIIGAFLGTSIPGSAIKISSVEYTKRNGLYVQVVRNTTLGANIVLNTYSPYHIVSIPKRSGKCKFEYIEDPTLTISDVGKR